jgi:hypothetical protein
MKKKGPAKRSPIEILPPDITVLIQMDEVQALLRTVLAAGRFRFEKNC